MSERWSMLIWILCGLVIHAAPAPAGPVTTAFTVTGAVSAPATFNYASLSALPPTTETVTYQTMSGPQTGTFTGPTLWYLLNNAVGLQSPPVKNGVLRQYVIAEGSDGYTAVFSMGELNPMFGGSNPQVLVGYQENGMPLGSTGFARIVAAKDNYGGRYVSNLANLAVGTAPQVLGTGGGPSTEFTLSGAVKTPGVYMLSTLEALPTTTETVTYLAGGTPVTSTFTGVSLWTLLTDAGIVTNPAIKNDILNYYVLATGTDGYEAVYSLGELDPMFGGNSMSPDLIAYEVDGGLLGAAGFARVVVPGDLYGGRYVSNLISLEVIDAIPEPTPLALLLWALLATAAWRRASAPAKPR